MGSDSLATGVDLKTKGWASKIRLQPLFLLLKNGIIKTTHSNNKEKKDIYILNRLKTKP